MCLIHANAHLSGEGVINFDVWSGPTTWLKIDKIINNSSHNVTSRF